MKSSINVISIITLVSGSVLAFLNYYLLRDGQLPVFPENNWGSSTVSEEQSDFLIRPFPINISADILQDLSIRLKLELETFDSRVEPSLPGVGFGYGVNSNWIRTVISHWLYNYDWRKREKVLNQWPGFKTTISGLSIYFKHIKPNVRQNGRQIKPLLLLHGYPGSFADYRQLANLLMKDDSQFVFEIIIPSYPGFAFSEGSKKTGLGAPEIGLMLLNLMKRLGHEKFYIHGGDWGHIIGSDMATLFPDNVLGFHTTMCHTFHPRSVFWFGVANLFPTWFMEKDEILQQSPFVYKWFHSAIEEMGYLHLQSTKPDVWGLALAHSPTGHATTLLVGYSWWNNQSSALMALEDGGITTELGFDLDDILDNVMLYWSSKSLTSAVRLYRETFNPLTTSHHVAVERVSVKVPVSCLNLPGEPMTLTKLALQEKYPKLRYTMAKTGGHSNLLQIPELVANDLIEAINFIDKS